jgi:[FeFe] hydrogenase H-cluster maturation GTPase HydF
MSMNQTPRGDRLHIALFGRRNAGKSSVINAMTHQNIAIVSDVKGTTTDPVYKAMEILPIGPVVIIDTAGLDDTGELGALRIKKTLEVLNKTDVALLVVDAGLGFSDYDQSILDQLTQKKIPVILVFNKVDQTPVNESNLKAFEAIGDIKCIPVSATTGEGIETLKETLQTLVPENEDKFRIVGDLVKPGDFVVLVTPIDKAAPKGRLILPQQQVIRDIIESDAVAIVTKEHELRETLEGLAKPPSLVITDSQVFLKVAADTPRHIPMTSFSILFARHKGDLIALAKGARAIEHLEDGDTVLISEGCTHHRQADDIGRVKIPRWLRQMTGKQLNFEFTSGTQFTEDVQAYKLIVHCGACMLNKTAMTYRIEQAEAYGVPIVNYGVLIGYVQGVLERALKPFKAAYQAYTQEE